MSPLHVHPTQILTHDPHDLIVPPPLVNSVNNPCLPYLQLLPRSSSVKDITMLQAMDAQNIRIMRKKMELQRLGLQRLLSTERCRVVL